MDFYYSNDNNHKNISIFMMYFMKVECKLNLTCHTVTLELHENLFGREQESKLLSDTRRPRAQ